MGTRPGAALVAGDRVVASAEFPGRTASAVVIGELRRMLEVAGWRLRELDGIGVVAGPGSFTGVRTGLATAKGLCEASRVRLASVSRLEVLSAAAGLKEGFAAVDAGRGSVYVREVRADGTWREWISTVPEMQARAAGWSVVVAEDRTAAVLAKLAPKLHSLSAIDMLPMVRRCLERGGSDLISADANYVLRESDIYRRPEPTRSLAATAD